MFTIVWLTQYEWRTEHESVRGQWQCGAPFRGIKEEASSEDTCDPNSFIDNVKRVLIHRLPW